MYRNPREKVESSLSRSIKGFVFVKGGILLRSRSTSFHLYYFTSPEECLVWISTYTFLVESINKEVTARSFRCLSLFRFLVETNQFNL